MRARKDQAHTTRAVLLRLLVLSAICLRALVLPAGQRGMDPGDTDEAIVVLPVLHRLGQNRGTVEAGSRQAHVYRMQASRVLAAAATTKLATKPCTNTWNNIHYLYALGVRRRALYQPLSVRFLCLARCPAGHSTWTLKLSACNKHTTKCKLHSFATFDACLLLAVSCTLNVGRASRRVASTHDALQL